MSEQLDPYYKWLGIAPKDQPPNHYRLLGVDAFETNIDVICNAADRQMAHLRSVSTGKHASLSQKLLNEISAARVCLLDPEKKDAYDSQLRAALEASGSPGVAMAAPPPEVSSIDAPSPPVAVSVESSGNTIPRRPVTSGNAPLIKVVAGGVGGVVLAGLFWMLVFNGDEGGLEADPSENVGQAAVAEAVTPATSTEVEAEPTSTEKLQPSKSESKSKPPPSVDLPDAGPNDDGGSKAANESSSNDSEKSATSQEPETEPDPGSATDTTSQAEPTTAVAANAPPEVTGADEESETIEPAEETSTTLPAGPKKLAVPSDDVQAETLLRIKDVFKASYEKAKTPAGQAELAKLLYDQAEELKDDPTVRFVMLRDGYNLAIEVKEFQLALQFVDRLAEDYELDELQLRLHMLTQAAAAARQTNDRREIAELALGLVDTAVKSKRFEDAIKLVELAESLAARARDTDLRAQARNVGKEVKGSQLAWNAVQQSLAALQTSPDDADANLACGQYFCFVEGDWQRGLPMLIKGSDQSLADAARQDRSNPLGPEDQEQLGDVWWKLRETQEGLAKVGSQVRAAHWYQRALPGLSGLAQSKVEKTTCRRGRVNG